MRIFENDLENRQGLVGAMLQQYCPDLDNIPLLPVENVALHPVYIEFKRLLNSGPFSASELSKILAGLKQLARHKRFDTVPSLWSKKDLQAFQPRIDAGNKAIAARYFRPNAELFKPVDFDNADCFHGLSEKQFADLLDQISEFLPQSLIDKIVRHLAQKMQFPRA